jgi:hypothetical protein
VGGERGREEGNITLFVSKPRSRRKKLNMLRGRKG